MGQKDSKPIKEERTSMIDDDNNEQETKKRSSLDRLFNRNQLRKLTQINIPGDSSYFYGQRVICMKSTKEFLVVYSSSYMIFSPGRRPRPTFLDYNLESPVYCNGYYYAVGRSHLMRISPKNGDIKRLKLKAVSVSTRKKSIKVSPDNRNTLLIFQNNSFFLYNTTTEKSQVVTLGGIGSWVDYILVPNNMILTSTHAQTSTGNQERSYRTTIVLSAYREEYDEPNIISGVLQTVEVPKGKLGTSEYGEYTQAGDLAYCKANKLVALALTTQHKSDDMRNNELRLNSVVFYKVKGKRLAFLTKCLLSYRCVPQNVGSVFTTNALTTSMLTLFLKGTEPNTAGGRILTIPFDSKNKKMLDYRIESNLDIKFGNSSGCISLCKFGKKLFGVDEKKMFYFLSAD